MKKEDRNLILGNIDFRLKVRNKERALMYCIDYLFEKFKESRKGKVGDLFKNAPMYDEKPLGRAIAG